MLTLPPSVKIYVATVPTDLRKSFDGLSSLVYGRFGTEPTSGHLFVFRNRRGNQLRVLFWDRTGYCIFAKRLAQGTFQIAASAPEASAVEIDAAELGLILEGIDLRSVQRRKRFRLPRKMETHGIFACANGPHDYEGSGEDTLSARPELRPR